MIIVDIQHLYIEIFRLVMNFKINKIMMKVILFKKTELNLLILKFMKSVK